MFTKYHIDSTRSAQQRVVPLQQGYVSTARIVGYSSTIKRDIASVGEASLAKTEYGRVALHARRTIYETSGKAP